MESGVFIKFRLPTWLLRFPTLPAVRTLLSKSINKTNKIETFSHWNYSSKVHEKYFC